MRETQNAKDSVYMALREQLAALNPARIVTTADEMRPGIVVEENEIDAALPLPQEVFVLRWHGSKVVERMMRLDAEVIYRAIGDEAMSRQDRGRRRTAMDKEIFALCERGSAEIADHSQQPAAPSGGKVMWRLDGIEVAGEGDERRAKLVVMFARTEDAA